MLAFVMLVALGFFAAAGHALVTGRVPPVTQLGHTPGEPVHREDDPGYFRSVVFVYLMGGVAMVFIAWLRF